MYRGGEGEEWEGMWVHMWCYMIYFQDLGSGLGEKEGRFLGSSGERLQIYEPGGVDLRSSYWVI